MHRTLWISIGLIITVAAWGCGEPSDSPPPETDRDGDGYSVEQGDCDDRLSAIHPGAEEIPYDGIDQDCSGADLDDLDSDGVPGGPRGADACDHDPEKIAPGACGCGHPETDSDGDAIADCIDACPADSDKSEPGVCGCGFADVDSDADGTVDCVDLCPGDPDKTEPGICGCGESDFDLDGDGSADCEDLCPDDPSKIEPAICGCGVPDTDFDHDETLDCLDACPHDPGKSQPGVCGCFVPDSDGDADGILDCEDNCPNRQNPSQADTDGDGPGDACDGCASDPLKTQKGICGCGVEDIDSDGDGTLDCHDACPADPMKTEVGICGCGVEDEDLDGDGVPDCVDDSYVQVSSSYLHTCGIRADGTLWCWGQVLRYTPETYKPLYRAKPLQIGSQSDWSWISVGGGHTCGIRSAGGNNTLWCFGSNLYDQIGGEFLAFVYEPVRVGEADDWQQVTCGGSHTCGVRQSGSRRTLWCWGSKFGGALGDGSHMDQPEPVQIGVGEPWLELQCGGTHCCALRDEDPGQSLWCWGQNYSGEVGVGTRLPVFVPTRVGVEEDWTLISLGNHYTCGLREEKDGGSLWCWGENGFGYLNPDNQGDLVWPTRIGEHTDWRAIFPSEVSTLCGLRGPFNSASLWCWGDNSRGQYGDGTEISSHTPKLIEEDSKWVTYQLPCGIRFEEGRSKLMCWGPRHYGNLGDGVFGFRLRPTRPDNFEGWTSLVTGGNTFCGLIEDGFLTTRMYCWGSTPSFDGTSVGADYTQNPASFDSITDWKKVSHGYMHICGIRSDDSIWCRGGNYYGELGIGNNTSQNSPVPVAEGSHWREVSAGADHTCAIRSDGTLWCWGRNDQGQIGDGTRLHTNLPLQIGIESDWKYIAAGDSHTCGIRGPEDSASLFCWGYNATGQLGDGTKTRRTTPTEVLARPGWTEVSTGWDFTCAIGSDTSLWCWGNNSVALGMGYVHDDVLVPTKVNEATGWTWISAGRNHTCGLRNAGTENELWCWGQNQHGQVGDDSITNCIFPTRIGTTTDWLEVVTGIEFTCGIRADLGAHSRWCWGKNFYGTLGDGQSWSTVPVPVKW
ncbi:MAG: hypothetical protein JRF33_18090 [Deltaproteobacteria bacterium]|nr:hypothetical protein [Deltaproteobacteria bacterium]